MKSNTDWMTKIISDYGSLEAYNEEQRRCGLAQIEVQAQSGSKKAKVECANVVETTQTTSQSVTSIRQNKTRLRLGLFGAKA